ncbi:Scr1 family TA system antitoxin-like transcriptional regulator [Streptomyces sp. NPDC048718]|uniref:helix-turn-helix domain-containing protein n=1 Tax=Streptomyces sp. NPDC048718 TaxID=3365587 RepID=UPI003717BC69
MVNRRDLDPDASPQAAYGARLRRMREERGLSQVELGVQAEYSGTHISQVENARKLPTLRFSRRVDLALETGDSFEREWREMTHGALLEGFPEYMEYEGRAAELRLFDTGIVPGLLQTPEYAQCLADSKVRRGAITLEQGDDLVSVLAERQATFTRPHPPTMMVVMDESCIRRQVGGPGTMGAQLDRLLEFAEQPNAVLQIAPFEIGERRALYLPINLLTLPDMTVIAYAESQTRGHLERESMAVWPLLTAYHHLQAEALSHAASVAMIQEARKGYL